MVKSLLIADLHLAGLLKMKKAVFLDRDGTIIRDRNYLRSPEQIEFFSGAPEALKALKSAGFLLIICTNQSGIARGVISEREYSAIERHFNQMLSSHGVSIDGSYYCPHLPDGFVRKYAKRCDCRKPAKGMFIRALKKFDIDSKASYAIGDLPRDLEPARNLGATTILVLTGKGRRTLSAGGEQLFADYICRDLRTACRKILALARNKAPSARTE